MAGTSDETYEKLRRILETQNGRSYTFDEAKGIGDGLIDFFSTLTEIEKDAKKFESK